MYVTILYLFYTLKQLQKFTTESKVIATNHMCSISPITQFWVNTWLLSKHMYYHKNHVPQ